MRKAAESLSTTSAALPADAAAISPFTASPGVLARLWRWLRSYHAGASGHRRLQVADTVSLGEKRFVAVVQVDGRHFLLAGGPANIALLAQLDEKDDFGDVLKNTMTVPNPAAQPAAAAPVPEAKAHKRRRRPGAAAKAPSATVQKQAAGTAKPKRGRAGSKSVKPAPRQAAPRELAKKQSKAAPKVAGKKPSPGSRFGNIPPATAAGARAFEQWLGRAVPPAQATAESEPKVRTQPVGRSVSKSGGPAEAAAKQTLNQWLQEVRTLPERPATPAVGQLAPVVMPQPGVEEYA